MNSATPKQEEVYKSENKAAGTSSKKIRVQFDFTEESLANLDNLVEVFGASSRAEIIRRSLTLLSDALEEAQNGRKLGFKDSEGSFEGFRFT